MSGLNSVGGKYLQVKHPVLDLGADLLFGLLSSDMPAADAEIVNTGKAGEPVNRLAKGTTSSHAQEGRKMKSLRCR